MRNLLCVCLFFWGLITYADEKTTEFRVDDLISELKSGGKGYGCNDDQTECWHMDYLGYEQFYIKGNKVKAVGDALMQSDACKRAVKYLIAKEHHQKALELLEYSIIIKANPPLTIKEKLGFVEFSVTTYDAEAPNGKIIPATKCYFKTSNMQ